MIRAIIPAFLPAMLLLAATTPDGAQSAAAPKNWTTAEDHRNMLGQLGITTLRPGPSGNETSPNHANTDESLANPFPDYPEILKLKDGRPFPPPAAGVPPIILIDRPIGTAISLQDALSHCQ